MSQPQTSPNVIFIMSDDHAAHAIGAYSSRINETPQIDRIANEGVRLDNCLCTNSICAPSRAVILTGTHSHVNGVLTLDQRLDGAQDQVQKHLGAAGYQTALFGKWHLGHGGSADPQGFDAWRVVHGQGEYHNPRFYHHDRDGLTRHDGYATDLITDFSLDWLAARDRDRPFFLCIHHKAPHRPWEPDDAHAHLYEDIDIPQPPTFDDDYANRSNAARNAEMRIDRDMTFADIKTDVPEGLSASERKDFMYQRYIKDYLRCIASVDDNIGRVLDYLDEEGIADDTIVIYTSDQGFFLGDHGWYDKRFMYEESLRMPFVMRYPREIPAGTTNDAIISNLDFAPLWLDYAGLAAPDRMQGRSFRAMVAGDDEPEDWPTALYYRYWMHGGQHNVAAHYGIRTKRYKLIYYYGDPLGIPGAQEPATEPEWELFDLEADPMELRSVYGDPAYADIVHELTAELNRLQAEAGDETYVAASRV